MAKKKNIFYHLLGLRSKMQEYFFMFTGVAWDE
jgi:hypothetical protein